jgi:hypothetical protein
VAASCESVADRAANGRRAARSLWGAHKWYAITWVRRIDPSRLACRKNMDHHKYGVDCTCVTRQVYVPAAYVGEGVACFVDRGRASGVVALIDRELSRYNGDQAGTGMRMPPSVTPGCECVLGHQDVRISLHPRLELPPEVRILAHQVERARRKEADRHIYDANRAPRRCEGRRDGDQRKCDEKWQN